MICPFKYGDLVTGRERHYERSIYRFISDNGGGSGTYEIVAYKGRIDFGDCKQMYLRLHVEFRDADFIEVCKATTRSHLNLINFLNRLDITRREYWV